MAHREPDTKGATKGQKGPCRNQVGTKSAPSGDIAVEFDGINNEAGRNSFFLSVKALDGFFNRLGYVK
jgi:hypothetical protein